MPWLQDFAEVEQHLARFQGGLEKLLCELVKAKLRFHRRP